MTEHRTLSVNFQFFPGDATIRLANQTDARDFPRAHGVVFALEQSTVKFLRVRVASPNLFAVPRRRRDRMCRSERKSSAELRFARSNARFKYGSRLIDENQVREP